MTDLNRLPILPLRDIVVFPHMVVPLFVGREKSIAALEEVMRAEKRILLMTQQDSSVDEPKLKDLFERGCVAKILQLLKLPDGTVRVLVEGQDRASISDLKIGDYMDAVVKINPSEQADKDHVAKLCLLYTSPSPRDQRGSRMPSSA